MGSRRVWRATIVAARETRNQGCKVGPLLERISASDQPMSAIERAGLELARKQPMPIERPG